MCLCRKNLNSKVAEVACASESAFYSAILYFINFETGHLINTICILTCHLTQDLVIYIT